MKPAAPLDFEPLMLRGLTGSELAMAVGVGGAVWVPTGILIALLVNPPMLGFVVFLVCEPLTVWILALWYGRLKTARPQGWHLQELASRFHGSGFFRHAYHNGGWRL